MYQDLADANSCADWADSPVKSDPNAFPNSAKTCMRPWVLSKLYVHV